MLHYVLLEYLVRDIITKICALAGVQHCHQIRLYPLICLVMFIIKVDF